MRYLKLQRFLFSLRKSADVIIGSLRTFLFYRECVEAPLTIRKIAVIFSCNMKEIRDPVIMPKTFEAHLCFTED